MMATTLSRLPIAAGGAFVSAAGQAGLWAFSHYMRAPLAHTAILATTVLSLMATGNALYAQHGRHPAPLFASQDVPVAVVSDNRVAEVVEPVVPAERPDDLVAVAPVVVQPQPQAQQQQVVPATTGSVTPVEETPDTGPIGNAEVYAVQKKLQELKYFNGKADGYYGPMTASAIRAFEINAGMTPQGALSRSTIDAILSAPGYSPIVQQQPQPVVQAAPAVQLQAPVQPAPEPIVTASLQQQPVPAPAEQPLGALVQANVAQTPTQPLTQVQPMATAQVQQVASTQLIGAVQASPSVTDNMLDAAGGTAANAFDMMAGALQSLTAPAKTDVASTGTPTPPKSVTAGDKQLVAQVQRGLAQLGFLAGAADGVAGDTTAKAIRNFEVYYNYPVTGRISPDLVAMLKSAGAMI